MIVHIASDAGQVLAHGDTKFREFLMVADAGLHEQLWCLNGALRKHDLKACFGLAELALVLELDARCPLAFKENTGRQRSRQNGEIRLLQPRVNVGTVDGLPFSIVNNVVDNGASPARPHHLTAGVCESLQPGRFRGIEHRQRERIRLIRLHVHWTAHTVEVRIGNAGPIFYSTPVEFEDGVVSPTGIAGFGGVPVPIRLVSSGPSPDIDAGAAAQDLSHRVKDGAPIQIRAWLRDEAPVEFTAKVHWPTVGI